MATWQQTVSARFGWNVVLNKNTTAFAETGLRILRYLVLDIVWDKIKRWTAARARAKVLLLYRSSFLSHSTLCASSWPP